MPAEKLLDPRLKPVMIVNNASSQALMKDHESARSNGLRNNVSEESIDLNQGQKVKSPNYVSRADWLTLAILTFINLINYMDRYTIAGKFFFPICRYKSILFMHLLFISDFSFR